MPLPAIRLVLSSYTSVADDASATTVFVIPLMSVPLGVAVFISLSALHGP